MGEIIFTITPSKALISPSIRSSCQMNLSFNIPSSAIPLKFSTLSCSKPKIPQQVRTHTVATSSRVSTMKRIPARDRVIDFGKYKGKMLGSLPSSYLKWVSKNLRAGDMEEWAKLADRVLSDPVYRDRIEWEFAEMILNGNAMSPYSRGNGSKAVSALLEISERLGWDNEDKGGWSRIDFGLLGTSKGGRIPRVEAAETNVELGSLKKEDKIQAEETSEEDGGRRRERKERVRQRRLKRGSAKSGLGTKRRIGKVEGYGNRKEMNDEDEDEEGEEGGDRENPEQIVGRSPFPGREALLKKVLDRGRKVVP